ncbi:hypothetical protein AC249_AIPGENE16309 [Exaiptasia diaphana]|nr:hypothetical protein AC249_AIPGENE16309 [Exaiptasia diaphana]
MWKKEFPHVIIPNVFRFWAYLFKLRFSERVGFLMVGHTNEDVKTWVLECTPGFTGHSEPHQYKFAKVDGKVYMRYSKVWSFTKQRSNNLVGQISIVIESQSKTPEGHFLLRTLASGVTSGKQNCIPSRPVPTDMDINVHKDLEK